LGKVSIFNSFLAQTYIDVYEKAIEQCHTFLVSLMQCTDIVNLSSYTKQTILKKRLMIITLF